MIGNSASKYKPNILICSNKGISSKYVFHTLYDIAIQYYEELKENYNVIFLTQYSAEKTVHSLLNKNNKKPFFDEIILYRDYFKDTKYDIRTSWIDVSDNLNIDSMPKIDKVIEIGSALSQTTKIQNGLINEEQMFNNKNQFKYISIRTNREYISLMLKTIRRDKCELEHFLIDPQELNYNDITSDIKYSRFFGYNSESVDFKIKNNFLKTHITRSYFTQDKIFDFTFGFTILTKDRNGFDIDKLQSELKNKEINIYIKDRFNNIDSFITKDLYLEKIRKSKFTLILPSYDTKTFSIFRYQESVLNGCLPLIYEDCFLDEVKKDFYIPDDIIVNLDNIQEKINTLDYKKIISKIKENMCEKCSKIT